jgi:hypothetical protein
MDRIEATKILQDGGAIELASKDATGDHWTYSPVWLDSDGDLVRSHPTQDRGTILVQDRDLRALRAT